MCLLICKPAGLKIPKERLINGDTNNPDGAGIAYVQDGKLVVDKGYFNIDGFMEEYEKHEDKHMLIHFRAASPQMDVMEEMCHPFYCETTQKSYLMPDGTARYQWAIGHNGRLTYNSSPKQSDTYLFVKEKIAPLVNQNPWHFDQEANRWLMEKFLGDTNKIVVMRYDREENEVSFYILNEKGGYLDKTAHYMDKVWYSNSSYLPPPPPVKTYQGYMAGMYPGEDDWTGYRDRENDYQPQGGVKSPPPLPSQGQEPVGIYANEFTKVDHLGWAWSYAQNGWVHKDTKVLAATLVHRPIRPLYIQFDEARRKAAEAKAKPDVKSGNAFTPKPKEYYKELAKQMALDSKNLTQEEFNKKYELGEFRKTSAKNTTIEVPRDAGVLKKNEDSDADNALAHLTKGEKRKLRRMAADWFRQETGANTKGIKMAEMVRWVRVQYREIFDLTVSKIGDEDLDRLIVQSHDRSANPLVIMEENQKKQQQDNVIILAEQNNIK